MSATTAASCVPFLRRHLELSVYSHSSVHARAADFRLSVGTIRRQHRDDPISASAGAVVLCTKTARAHAPPAVAPVPVSPSRPKRLLPISLVVARLDSNRIRRLPPAVSLSRRCSVRRNGATAAFFSVVVAATNGSTKSSPECVAQIRYIAWLAGCAFFFVFRKSFTNSIRDSNYIAEHDVI